MLRNILRTDPESQGDRRPLAAVLLDEPGIARCRLIAELKRRSPSAGSLRESLDPTDLARRYVEAGAAAVSVLTDPHGFGGSLHDLERVAAAVPVPVLRKDFLTSAAQVRESAAAGAGAVLLIVRLLGPERLGELAACARDSGLEPLVEIHDASEMEAALASGADVVGVNNRDLETFATDVRHSLALAGAAREGRLRWPRVAVSESGIRTRAEVLALADAGYRAVLVGESLLRAADPGRAVAEQLGAPAGAGTPA
jgi:indole-3-glycerol phosphate synthase